jgi:hypothetical protein
MNQVVSSIAELTAWILGSCIINSRQDPNLEPDRLYINGYCQRGRFFESSSGGRAK